MTDLLYAGIDFFSALSENSFISGLLFVIKLLAFLVSAALVFAIIYMVRASNLLGLKREELSWYLAEEESPAETPSKESEDGLHISWQYLYDRLNDEQVEPREIVLQAEQLFKKALSAQGSEAPFEGELAEVQGQVALLKRNSHLLVSSAEARRMVEV